MGSENTNTVADMVHQIVLGDFREAAAAPAFAGKALWAAMKRCGTELWLDTGDIDESTSLWCSEFTALTTNNTLLNREVQKGIYDELVATVARRLQGRVPDEDLVLETAFVLNAYHGLRLSRQFGAMVSVELHTDLSHDVARSVAYGRRYHAIAPDAFYVKVPLTPAGLLAARQLSLDGIPVNFTLGFGARQNYLITTVARPAFVNVFLGRLNSFVADHQLGDGKLVGEKATLSAQRVVCELRSELGVPTRLIAASLREGAQVAALAGVDVLTMPPKVAHGFEQLDPDPASLSSQVAVDPQVELAPGVDRQALGIDALWDVPDDLKAAVRSLLSLDLAHTSPADLCGALADRGFADLLPDWSPADIATITADGKIPPYPSWQDRLASGEVGLDALMNVSGLQSFVTDQEAMDDRIRSML